MDSQHKTILPNIRSLSREELEQKLYELKQPRFRIKQIWDWLWNKRISSFEDMKNVPQSLREALAQNFQLEAPLLLTKQVSKDGSRKYLLGFSDGSSAECVGIPQSKGRLSVCVSCQVGCGMACEFCATGRLGLIRSLKTHEILEQVICVEKDFGQRVSSVVFMGQGEPFTNYDDCLKAMRMLNDPEVFNIGARHITVSTCGVAPMIDKFSNEKEQFTLAISLHSAIQETRDYLMPKVQRWTLTRLRNSIADYSNKTGRRPSFEYALIGGVNDSKEHIQALQSFCEGLLCHVNFIELNEIAGSPFHPSKPGVAQEFIRALAQVGVESSLRNSRGGDIDAACGQLHELYRKQQ